ncbi:Histidine kinase [Seminavis robusta]|uniref:Histidine kinase n=1 Tax=Seminavis robusta TaxID=568900 RepID=A0A9N8H1S4_9STRA|nr:Histidine kinase [Seminavis robusta]|eukprot:Sro22_g015210.1 Histidine kinase (447) ;mRNA; r:37112-38636
MSEEKERSTPARSWSFQLPDNEDKEEGDGVDVPEDRPLSEADRNLQNSHQVPFYKFVLTGGPCGGKTTGLARVYYFLKERGFEVVNVAEAFTILASNGMSGDFFATQGMDVVIQHTVMDVQMGLEDGVERILRARGRPAVMMCDRGTMDGAAYMERKDWHALLKDRGTTETEIRDNRYNAVFHMVSAADGAEPHYTLENNQARTEDAEAARMMDRKTQKAWVGHSHLYVFDNSTDFERKLERLVDVIAKLVGLPSNLKRNSAKFVLRTPPKTQDFPEDIDYHIFSVEKVYLTTNDGDDDTYSFIRKRTNLDPTGKKQLGFVYQLTTVTRTPSGDTIEEKRIITAREYSSAYLTRDVCRHIVLQKRISFLYKLQSFTIHIYQQPVSDICILHAQVEATEASTEPNVDLPPFLDVEKRLSDSNEEDEEKYSAYNISLINKIPVIKEEE